MNLDLSGVLVVDDGVLYAQGLSQLMEFNGFKNIHIASNNRQALEMLKRSKHEIKLIITDISRGFDNIDGTGIDLIKQVSKTHNYILGIIVCSTHAYSFSKNNDIIQDLEDSINPINIVNLKWFDKNVNSSLLFKTSEGIIHEVMLERKRQNRLSANEKIALYFENNKFKLIGYSTDTQNQFFDNFGKSYLLSYTYLIESISIKQSIEELEELINKKNIKESELQHFFNKNPNFLIDDNYKAIHPHLIFTNNDGKKLIPDYVLEPVNTTHSSDILDIKLPSKKVFTRGRYPHYSRAINSVASQLKAYSNFFDNQNNRKKIKDKYDLTIYNPKMIAIIGRRTIYDPVLIKRISKTIPDITVKTYDDLIDKMKFKIK